MADDHPQYKKYRSRPRFPWERDDDLAGGEPREDAPKPRRRIWPFRRRVREPGRRRKLTVGRVLGYLAMGVVAWLLTKLPMPDVMRTIIYVVAAILGLLLALQQLGFV